MDYIIEYISYPMRMGVYNFNFELNLSNLEGFFKYITKKLTTKKLSPQLRAFASERVKELGEGCMEGYMSDEEVFNRISDALSLYIMHPDCPRDEFREFVSDFNLAHGLPKIQALRRLEREHQNLFEPSIQSRLKDVIFVEKSNPNVNDVWFLDVTTIKKDGVDAYKNFISNIPVLKNNTTFSKERHTFSSRYTFRPFPLAVQLWLLHGKTTSIPEDLKDFLWAAIRYHKKEEWRTSIILSAIAVESLLADIYEEKYHKSAPNIPLGNLFTEVQQKMTLPPNIDTAIAMANDVRIAAVHRSRFSVSDRDSMNALFGATNLMMWYFSQL